MILSQMLDSRGRGRARLRSHVPPPRTIIIGTAGHIDHGKTALVRALTGIDCDRLPAEKERGITIDLGFANLSLGEIEIGIVDVPGHERFVKNMLAGASGIDLALLVIAADDSVMPQTREHLAILELLQIDRGVIALTKCDIPEGGWIDLVEQEVCDLVADTFLRDAPIVRTSAQTGSGISDLKSQIAEIARAITHESRDGFFRLPIDRTFVGQGVGTIVTGTVWSGEMTAGRSVRLLPAGKDVRVRALQSHGRDAERVQRGQRAAINLMGVHHTEIERGNEIVEGDHLSPSRLMTVDLRAVPGAPWPVRNRARVRLHIGTQEILARVRLLESERMEIAPGERAFAQLILASPGGRRAAPAVRRAGRVAARHNRRRRGPSAEREFHSPRRFTGGLVPLETSFRRGAGADQRRAVLSGSTRGIARVARAHGGREQGIDRNRAGVASRGGGGDPHRAGGGPSHAGLRSPPRPGPCADEAVSRERAPGDGRTAQTPDRRPCMAGG